MLHKKEIRIRGPIYIKFWSCMIMVSKKLNIFVRKVFHPDMELEITGRVGVVKIEMNGIMSMCCVVYIPPRSSGKP